MSKLCINEDKTTLLIFQKPKHEEETKDLEIETNDDKENVKPTEQAKIKGYLTNIRGSMLPQMNKIVSEVSYMLNTTNKMSKYLTFEARKNFVNSYVIGKLNYSLPLMCGQQDYIKQKVHTVLMRAGRFARVSYCYKESTDSILKSINLKNHEQLIAESGAKFVHKVIFHKNPVSILSKYRPPRSRPSSDYVLTLMPKQRRFPRTLINAAIHEYNRLPEDMRSMEPSKMKSELKSRGLLKQKPRS